MQTDHLEDILNFEAAMHGKKVLFESHKVVQVNAKNQTELTKKYIIKQ